MLLAVLAKETPVTHEVCPFSPIKNLQSPRVFHRRMVLSLEPETICLFSGEKATDITSFLCPTNLREVTPVFKSQSLRVLSQDPERAN